MKLNFIAFILAAIALLSWATPAEAFCGFYVGKADTKLYNQASQVIIARDGDRNILTMANDYQGEVKDFALVVPVPVVLQPEQVNVGEPKIIERLDGFSSPRLVEYFDSDPCMTYLEDEMVRSAPVPQSARQESRERDGALGVTIEAQFSAGEYDILILSATESNGLETWWRQNGYKLPNGAASLLQPYIRQNLKFFVAKVNLDEFAESGYKLLRPLQIAYESSRFMLPIRLGMMNATSEQDLIVYILSPRGQAEVTNYRTVKIPSNEQIPLFVKNEFGDFYRDMFQNAYKREDKKVAFLEYAWNMASCDPCSADPLNPEELRQAGVFWLDEPGKSNVFISRIHVRYSRDKFPEDLMFQETGNNEFFQGRYILRHPFTGEAQCQEAREYQRSLPQRYEQEAQTLAKLTDRDINEIREKMNLSENSDSWWQKVWPF
jgi:hypothetical protein